MTFEITGRPGEFAAALEKASFKAEDPELAALLADFPQETHEPLNWQGMDTDDALKALRKPPLVRVRAFSLDRFERHLVFPLEGVGTYLLISGDGSTTRILAPVTSSEIFALFAEQMRPIDAPPPVNASFELDAGGLAALFASIDALRELYAASLMERRGFRRLAIPLQHLQDQVKKGAETSDFRWLCALLPHLLPDTKLAKQKRMLDGCQALESLQLLHRLRQQQDPVFTPTGELMHIAQQFFTMLPVLIFDRGEQASAQSARRNMLVAGKTIWHGVCGPTRSTFRCLDGLSVIQVLDEELNLGQAISAQAEKPVSEAYGYRLTPSLSVRSYSPQTREPLEASDQPGFNNTPPDYVKQGYRITACQACGKDILVGMTYCHHCGAAQTQANNG